MCYANKRDWEQCPETRAPQTENEKNEYLALSDQFETISDQCLDSKESLIVKDVVYCIAQDFSKYPNAHVVKNITTKQEVEGVVKWLGKLCDIENDHINSTVILRCKAQMNFPFKK